MDADPQNILEPPSDGDIFVLGSYFYLDLLHFAMYYSKRGITFLRQNPLDKLRKIYDIRRGNTQTR